MATSEAFTAGLIIVLPLLPVLGILGDCWRREAVEPERGIEATKHKGSPKAARRQLKQKALRQAIEAELAANQARGTAEDANVAGGFPPA
jgi:hypothetical protein